MPAWLKQKDEKRWSEAKEIVRKQVGKHQAEWTDKHWTMVNSIFHRMRKSIGTDHSDFPQSKAGGPALEKQETFDLNHVVGQIRAAVQDGGNGQESEEKIKNSLGNHAEWELKNIPIDSVDASDHKDYEGASPPREPLDKPLIIFGNKIIDGHHRYAAFKRSGKKTIRAYMPKKTSNIKSGQSWNEMKKSDTLEKARIYNFGFDPSKKKGHVLADLPSETSAINTSKPKLHGVKGQGIPSHENAVNEAHERIKDRFGYDEGRFDQIHRYLNKLKDHDEPYAGGDAANVSYRTIEKDKGRWNDPMPFPARVKDLKGVLGKRVASGGPDPFMWMDKKFGATRSVLAEHHEKPLSIHTRSDLVAHDEYHSLLNKEKHAVNMHIMTRNSNMSRQMEPGAPSPERRIVAANRLAELGHKVSIVHDVLDHPDLHPEIKKQNHLDFIGNALHPNIDVKENKIKLTEKALNRAHRSMGLPVGKRAVKSNKTNLGNKRIK